jgi:hypothetical protein
MTVAEGPAKERDKSGWCLSFFIKAKKKVRKSSDKRRHKNVGIKQDFTI